MGRERVPARLICGYAGRRPGPGRVRHVLGVEGRGLGGARLRERVEDLGRGRRGELELRQGPENVGQLARGPVLGLPRRLLREHVERLVDAVVAFSSARLELRDALERRGDVDAAERRAALGLRGALARHVQAGRARREALVHGVGRPVGSVGRRGGALVGRPRLEPLRAQQHAVESFHRRGHVVARHLDERLRETMS